MHRWFPIPAALAVALWAAALGSPLLGGSGRPAGRWAALATLLPHLATLGWAGAGRTRRAVARGPEWVRVQEAKHRRKATWFAGWGLAVVGVGWLVASWGEGPATGPGGPASWFGAALNLGFQPGVLAAEWASIVAMARLGRSVAG